MRIVLRVESNLITLPSLPFETAVPRLTPLVTGLSPQRPGFDPTSVHVGFVVDKVRLG
jgi:hypothetical protein